MKILCIRSHSINATIVFLIRDFSIFALNIMKSGRFRQACVDSEFSVVAQSFASKQTKIPADCNDYNQTDNKSLWIRWSIGFLGSPDCTAK